MDAFFVSVELLARPELKGQPVVVGGQPNQRGVVSAASYEARKFGIHSAMPLRTAGKLCPHAVFLEPNHAQYSKWSGRVAAVLQAFSPVVEMASVDEAYLDLSGTERLHGNSLAAADKLLREITAKTGLPCSGGLASTRLVAKVASDQAKPRGLLLVPPGSEASFLGTLVVRKIPGIGKAMEESLRKRGIETVAQLASRSREELEKEFGRWGTALYRKARGLDTYQFFTDAEAKSISNNHTFAQDTADLGELEGLLSHLCQKSTKRMRDAGLHARTITLTIRYEGFETHTHGRTIEGCTDLDTVVLATARQLFHQHWDRRRRVRLLGVSLTNFTHGEGQTSLLDGEKTERLERLARATDKVRDRFGFGTIQLGGSLRPPKDRK
jgi:DNA polymerase-4